MREIDCRGLPCPQPVINTKNALDEIAEGETLVVLVDNEAAVKNVTRFAEAQGHEVRVEEKEGHFALYVTKKGPGREVSLVSCAPAQESPAVIVFSSRGMGEGDETLSRLLLKALVKTLRETSQRPQAIICYNQGVFLTLEDSEVLEDLKALEAEGIKILVCGTCLDYYRVKDKLAVGQISNMYDILETMLSARVIKP